MGERDWYARYRAMRDYADLQALAYGRGEEIEHWRHVTEYKEGMPEPAKERVTGAMWVSWAYEIAAAEARTLVQVKGPAWQPLVDECLRLAASYREQAQEQEDTRTYMEHQYTGGE